MFQTPSFKLPAQPAATPLPQPDDPALIDIQREASIKAQQSEGFEASLLTPPKQNTQAAAVTKTATLGVGALI